MKAIFRDDGSVLMEFLVVLPIYIVLFAGVFLVGDMSVKSMRLASADRTRAFDVASDGGVASSGLAGIRKFLFPGTAADEDLIKDEGGQWHRHYTAPNYPGPWTVAVGAKVRDDYKLAPWTRGWLAFADWFFGAGIGQDAPGADDAATQLAAGRRLGMYSKDVATRTRNNYVTYRRTRIYGASRMARMYRAMPAALGDAGRLLDRAESWRAMVGEPWPGVGKEKNDWSGAMPELEAREYRRYFDGERARRWNL